MVKSAQVSVTTTPTLLKPPVDSTDSTSGNSYAFHNMSSVIVWIGGSDVSTSNGYPVMAGFSSPTIPGGQVGGESAEGDDFYGVVASGTATVAVLRSK